MPARADDLMGSESIPLHLQQSDDGSSSSSQDPLSTPYHLYDTLDDGVLEAKAIHSPMVRRGTGSESSRMVGSSSVDSQQDYFKMHWAKAGPVPPARRAVRAKVSTTVMSPSSSGASVPARRHRRTEMQASSSIAEPSPFINKVASERADPFHDSHGVTQDSSRVSTATITQIASSTFDAEGTRARGLTLTKARLSEQATPRAAKVETSVRWSGPISEGVLPDAQSGKENLRVLLMEYNASVKKATAEIHLSLTSSQQSRDESLSPHPSPSKNTLPRPLRRLGLDKTPLVQRTALLEGLLQHLVHVHFYEEIVEVFCYGCGTKADDAAKALITFLQSTSE